LRELYKDIDLVADIKNKKLEWTVHVESMDQGRRVKKIFQSKPKGSRTGRLKLKWLKDEEKDLQQMNIKRWSQRAVDREEFASII
jgi:hypothetical protein